MRITERKLRRVIRQVIRESMYNDIHITWIQVENSLRDDEYYMIDDLRMEFEDLPPMSPEYEEYRSRFEDAAHDWMSRNAGHSSTSL